MRQGIGAHGRDSAGAGRGGNTPFIARRFAALVSPRGAVWPQRHEFFSPHALRRPPRANGARWRVATTAATEAPALTPGIWSREFFSTGCAIRPANLFRHAIHPGECTDALRGRART